LLKGFRWPVIAASTSNNSVTEPVLSLGEVFELTTFFRRRDTRVCHLEQM